MNYCTIGIFAHANAGKTTVTENLLHLVGVTERIGRVDSGTTITDNMKIERERGITVKSSYVSFQHGERCFQLLDTPGHVDFSSEVVRAMSVLDAAILVISGVERIEAQTLNIWHMLETLHIPTMIFVNKLDRLGADYTKTIQSIKESLSKKVVSLQEIIIEEKNIHITDLSWNNIAEQLAEFDDETLVYCLENEDNVSDEWVRERLSSLYRDGDVFCIAGGSALSEIGVNRLLDFISAFLPSYATGGDNDFSGEVYSVKCNGGQNDTYIKVLSGKLENRMQFFIGDDIYKVRTLSKVVGSQRCPCEQAGPGELVIATGLPFKPGEIISKDNVTSKTKFSLSPMFTAILSIAGEIEKEQLWLAAKELGEEDPFLNVRLDQYSHNIQIDLMGKLQGETIIQIIQERYHLSANMSKPTIIYKEAPTQTAIGKAGYTKTSNVALRIIPGERGSGVRFVSLLASDYLFTKYQKQVERLMYSCVHFGLLGWDVTDIEIQLIGGKCDNVGSEPHDYSIAAPIAFSRALKSAETMLLEPVVSYTISIPSVCYTEIIRRLMGMRNGYSNIVDDPNGNIVITGTAYLSEIVTLIDEIKDITGGRGILYYQLEGYKEALLSEKVRNPMELPSPHNESQFVLQMNGIMDNLDKGLETKRGKPEKIKRNKHLWKTQRG